MQLTNRVHRWAAVAFSGAVLIAVPVATIGAGNGTPAGATPGPALTVTPTSLTFPETTLGDFTALSYTVTNTSATIDVISGYTPSGANPNDFGALPGTNCTTDPNDNIDLAAGASCTIVALFSPGALGARSATLTLNDTSNSNAAVTVSGIGGIGYYQVDNAGTVAYAGDAAFYGDASSLTLNKPIVAIAPTGDDGGYWLVASDGGIFNYGPSAHFYGSAGGLPLNKPIVGMAASGDGLGYWLVASDGGIFDYGDAGFYGSAGGLSLNQPIVAMAAMPDGGGYWFSAADGGLFNYGTAPFLGSGAGLGLGPVVDMATDGAPTLQANTDEPAFRHTIQERGGWAVPPAEPRQVGS